MLAPYPEPPQALFRDLFVAVQTAALYPDSKSFADAVPRAATPEEILAAYHAAPPDSAAALKEFAAAHFLLPTDMNSVTAAVANPSLVAHIDALWIQLTRSTMSAPPYTSLLPLPKPYVIPGGRFREIY